jgi:hypothetical protein
MQNGRAVLFEMRIPGTRASWQFCRRMTAGCVCTWGLCVLMTKMQTNNDTKKKMPVRDAYQENRKTLRIPMKLQPKNPKQKENTNENKKSRIRQTKKNDSAYHPRAARRPSARPALATTPCPSPPTFARQRTSRSARRRAPAS